MTNHPPSVLCKNIVSEMNYWYIVSSGTLNLSQSINKHAHVPICQHMYVDCQGLKERLYH